jgi:Domain of unknown function (DUF4286)
MIIYNVTVKIDRAVADEWLAWMLDVHIPEVMNTGLFTENHVLKVLVEDPEGLTYSIQYYCKSMADYEKYRDEFAPALQAETQKKYKDRFVAFRTLLEVIK